MRTAALRSVALCTVEILASAFCVYSFYLALHACMFCFALRAFLLGSCAQNLLQFLFQRRTLRSFSLPVSYVRSSAFVYCPGLSSFTFSRCALVACKFFCIVSIVNPFPLSLLALFITHWTVTIVCANVTRSINTVFDVPFSSMITLLGKFDDSEWANFQGHYFSLYKSVGNHSASKGYQWLAICVHLLSGVKHL